MTTDLTVATLCIISALFLTKHLKTVKTKSKPPLNLPPGSLGWPIVGETVEFFRAGMNGTPQRFMEVRREKYKSDVFKTSLIGQPVVILAGPSGNRFVFGNENKVLRAWWPPSMKKTLGKCIVNTVGDEARLMRKMVSSFMSPDAFSRLNYVQIISLVAQQHLNNHWEGKRRVNVFDTIKAQTFEIACRLFMSLEDADQIANLAALFNIFLKGVISTDVYFPGTRFYNAMKATSVIRKQLQQILRRRRTALEEKTATATQDLLSHLLTSPYENGQFMPESVIMNNILMLLFAGHDTSTSAMTMLIKYLAQFPEIYEKVLREQKEIASSKAPGEYVKWEDIQKMRYSWAVASEVMRLFPPAIGAFREVIADTKFQGYDIPKGWKVYWSAPATHSDPNFFKEYLKFDPSRFEGAGPSPFSYVPFGGGARMCVGQEFARLEILIFLHHVITRFKWNLLIPDEKIEFDPTPQPVEGLPISLHSHTA